MQTKCKSVLHFRIPQHNNLFPSSYLYRAVSRQIYDDINHLCSLRVMLSIYIISLDTAITLLPRIQSHPFLIFEIEIVIW